MALMIGALMLKGVTPGPQVITDRPDLFWGLAASMWIGNLMLIVLNLPLVGIWVRLVSIPYRYLSLTIMLFCAIGAYSVTRNVAEIYTIVFFRSGGLFAAQAEVRTRPSRARIHPRTVDGGAPAARIAHLPRATLPFSSLVPSACSSWLRAWRCCFNCFPFPSEEARSSNAGINNRSSTKTKWNRRG